jgi:peptide/nickel transport system substrate-binding protein
MSFLEPTDIRSFDDVNPWICYCWSIMLTNDSIFQGNWVDGPAGSGKMSWLLSGGFEGMPQWMTAGLAPTWEASATDNSMTLHLRQGVHFFNKAPVNGREMTADDVVYSIKRQWTIPTAFLKNTYPAPTSVVKVDKYTVKVTWGSFADMTNDIMQVGGLVEVWPHEVFDTYGNAQDWRNSNGTGPFMITDYVKNSSATFVKNPDYYLTDPLGPGKGNKLPYVDGIKMLIIPDISTQNAALRTGKLDVAWPIAWDSAKSLRQTSPQLKMIAGLFNAYDIFLRVDNPKFPWYNLQVRQAMMMATDQKSVASDFYGGEAEWFSFPVPAAVEYKDIQIPFSQLPADVQNLWTYQPDKAKQMLAAAGYPNGFDIKVDYENYGSYTDLLSVFKNYWAKIGINMILQPRDPSAFASIATSQTHENAYFYTNHTALLFNMDSWRYGTWNGCMLNDPTLTQTWKDIWNNYLDWNKQCALFKAQIPYILQQCWMIPTPSYYQYTVWQPWVMNYHGELNLGNCDRVYAPQFIWIDQDAKFAATGTR